MYVCAKNGNSHLLDMDAFSDILLKKMDFMHVEGISQVAYSLQSQGIENKQLWTAINQRLLSKDSLIEEYVQADVWNPKAFDLASNKGGIATRGHVHFNERYYTEEVRQLIYEQQYVLVELHDSFNKAGKELVDPDVLNKVNAMIESIDQQGSKRQIFEKMSTIYEKQSALESGETGGYEASKRIS